MKHKEPFGTDQTHAHKDFFWRCFIKARSPLERAPAGVGSTTEPSRAESRDGRGRWPVSAEQEVVTPVQQWWARGSQTPSCCCGKLRGWELGFPEARVRARTRSERGGRRGFRGSAEVPPASLWLFSGRAVKLSAVFSVRGVSGPQAGLHRLVQCFGRPDFLPDYSFVLSVTLSKALGRFGQSSLEFILDTSYSEIISSSNGCQDAQWGQPVVRSPKRETGHDYFSLFGEF